MIELVEVTKRYPNTDRPVVDAVSLTVGRGELVALLGESGSGKTTLLRMVNRLVDPEAGTVRVDGHDVRTRDPVALRRTIGYVIQAAGLFPHFSVADNIAVVPRLLAWSEPDVTARVDTLLELVGLPAAEYRARYPDELSGGQRQRIGVARALAARPSVLLLDEPFGALDPITRTALQAELRAIHAELKLTTVIVTHDLVEALTLADRVAVLYRGQLRQVATPAELLAAPADEYVARLVASVRHHAEQLAALARPAP